MAENGNGFHNPGNDFDHHFPTFEDRARSSTRNVVRSGRLSPTHSAHGSLVRSSLMTITTTKRAKKVRFYRNGDRYFEGMVYAVSAERFRTFESLMAALTTSPLGDKVVLPKGVRCVFSIDGSHKITSLDQLEEGENYVCASTNVFKKIDYPRSNTPNWSVNQVRGKGQSTRTSPASSDIDDNREFIHPKLITVIRNGAKPRKAVRILLNRKTAHSFDQVMRDITQSIQLDSGSVKKVYTVDGKPVTCLFDFFGEETVFVAYGNERYALDDFDMDNNEIKFVSAYRSVRQNERITLKSPKAPRRAPLTPTSTRKGQQKDYQIPSRKPSTEYRIGAASPKSPRRVRPKSPAQYRLANGVNGNGHNGNIDSDDLAPPRLLAKYKIGKTIGEGNFAVVKECTEKTLGTQYALKVINKAKCRGREQMIESEVSILRRVKHTNIIQLMEDYNTVDEMYLVMELVKGGDLFDAISSSTKYTEQDASGMLYNLAGAIKYLHGLNIVHRDIKPENLLVCEFGDGTKSIKLGDFGLATDVTGVLTTVCGTPTYVAPEVLAESGYGLKVDIWSAGVITYILLCGFPPFVSPSHNQEELFDLIIEGKLEYPAPFWDEVSDSAKDLLSHMLDVDPELRYSAAEVQDHPWVADDLAKDQDLHASIAQQLSKTASKKRTQPAMALITATALDKASRFFPGRKHSQSAQEYGGHSDDEVF